MVGPGVCQLRKATGPGRRGRQEAAKFGRGPRYQLGGGGQVQLGPYRTGLPTSGLDGDIVEHQVRVPEPAA